MSNESICSTPSLIQCFVFCPQMSNQLDRQYLMFKGKNVTWYRPNFLDELLALKKEHPAAKIIVGNSEVGTLKHKVVGVTSYH